MKDDRIKDIYEEYGRIVTGKEYALIHAIAEAVVPKREWVYLTDEDRISIRERVQQYTSIDSAQYGFALQVATEQAIKEKNA